MVIILRSQLFFIISRKTQIAIELCRPVGEKVVLISFLIRIAFIRL